ncbi:MAG: cation transporting ATPase C-terminal domain-containing protein [Eggerthella lenta]
MFRNIQKVVSFLVADNVAQIVVLLTAVALNWNAPLTAVMILWVNLATASLPALALGVEPASRHIMEHPPMRVNNLLDGPLARRVIFQGVFIAALALVAFVIGQNAGSYELGCTMAFGVLGFSQVLRSLNQRSATDPVWDREGARNRQLGLAAAASIALMLVVLLVPPFIEAFGGTTMNLGQWALWWASPCCPSCRPKSRRPSDAGARAAKRAVAGKGHPRARERRRARTAYCLHARF